VQADDPCSSRRKKSAIKAGTSNGRAITQRKKNEIQQHMQEIDRLKKK